MGRHFYLVVQALIYSGILWFSFGKALPSRQPRLNSVHQNSSVLGLIHSTADMTATMHASGSPAGILNTGGTTTSFSANSTISQNKPQGSSSSVGGAPSASCGGGQIGAMIVGQQSIGIQSVGNCNSTVIPGRRNEDTLSKPL